MYSFCHAAPAPVHCQAFIQRAGTDILVHDLPPKSELVLRFAPTDPQLRLLQSLLDLIRQHDRKFLRDIEVSWIMQQL
jgi:SNF2 family DNA or RNA helicase